MSLIDPRAIIDPSARLAADVEVGPWSIIGPDVEIGEGTVIGPHVIVKGPTVIGRHNRIYQFSSVGEDTPDLKYKGEPTRLVIGDNNTIRECVTIHRGTVQDRSETTIGNNNLLMAYVHIGHDTVFGSPAEARSMNFEGMRRRGFSDEVMHALRRAYKVMYRKGLTVEEALADLAADAAQYPEVALFCDSVRSSTRGITR